MMACIGWTWEREVRLRFHPLQMGEMAHGRLAFSWPACTGCLPLSESIEISSLHQLAGLKRPRISRNKACKACAVIYLAIKRHLKMSPKMWADSSLRP